MRGGSRCVRINALLVLFAASITAPRRGDAQENSERQTGELGCPREKPSEGDENVLKSAILVFTGPSGYGRFGQPAAPPHSRAGFVTDEAECRALATAVIAALPRIWTKTTPADAKATYKWLTPTYVRVGPYYAVLIYRRPLSTDKFIANSRWPLAIFHIVPDSGEQSDDDAQRAEGHEQQEGNEQHEHDGERRGTIRYLGFLLS